jgi:hypothetical protein
MSMRSLEWPPIAGTVAAAVMLSGTGALVLPGGG